QELGIRAHERHRHRHLRAIWQDGAQLLDDAEDVVPAAGIQTDRPLAQFPEDLVHLERGEDRLDQDRRANRGVRQTELLLGKIERVVPEACFEVALELRQVVVRSRAALEQLAGVVKAREAEVEQARGDGLPVDENVPLAEVPTTWPDDERRRLVAKTVT